jgi:cytochrome P450
MTNADGEDHLRLRKVCAGAFGPRRVHHVRERTQNLANSLLDPLLERGSGDLVEDFAYPLGITTICELIGIPDVLMEQVRAAALIIAAGDTSDTPAILRATDTFDSLFTEMLELKRREPGPDLVTDLIAKVDTGDMSDAEVASTAFLTLIAGYETTISLIASTALSLIERPADAARARTDDEFLSAVIEEVLRRDAPIQNSTWRFVTEPLTLAGQAMEPGDPVLLSLLAANRDPDAFPDPLVLAPGGRSTRHVAFGRGPHMCIGAGLARMQATTAIHTLLTRADTITLTVPEAELQWWPSPITRGLHHLPVSVS